MSRATPSLAFLAVLLIYVAIPTDGPSVRQAFWPAVVVGIVIGSLERFSTALDGAAFEGVEELRGVEAEYLGMAEVPDHPSVVRTAEGMSRIEQKFQISATRNLLQCLDVAGTPPEMNPHDTCCARRDESLYLLRIERMRHRIDVTEDRRDLLPLQRVSGRNESERRHDHLAAKPQRAREELQRNRAVAHQYAVAHADKLRDASFELEFRISYTPKCFPLLISPFLAARAPGQR